MKSQHKQWRKAFREGVFERDNNRCAVCSDSADEHPLDAHHITDRHEMPNGGYVLSNGITLCDICHIKSEKYHSTEGKEHVDGYHPNDLYKLIGSSYEQALSDSENLI